MKHKSKKGINSLKEEDDSFKEDDDVDSLMLDSPEKLKEQSKQAPKINKELLGWNLKKKNKQKIFSTDQTSTQNDTSHHQFKLSISSIDDQKAGASNKLSHTDQNLSSDRKSKRQSNLKKSQQNQKAASKPSRDEDKTKDSTFLTGLGDDFSIIMQTSNEDESPQQLLEARSFDHQNPIKIGANHPQRRVTTVKKDLMYGNILNNKQQAMNTKQKIAQYRNLQNQRRSSGTAGGIGVIEEVRSSDRTSGRMPILTQRNPQQYNQSPSIETKNRPTNFGYKPDWTAKNQETIKVYKTANQQLLKFVADNNGGSQDLYVGIKQKLRKSMEFYARKTTMNSFNERFNNIQKYHSTNQANDFEGNRETTQPPQSQGATSFSPATSGFSQSFNRSSRGAQILRHSEEKYNSNKLDRIKLQMMRIEEQPVNPGVVYQFNQTNSFHRTRRSLKMQAKLVYKIEQNNRLDRILKRTSPTRGILDNL